MWGAGAETESLLRSTSSRHRPWQVALAVAAGLVCGLVPKTGFLFVGLLACCYCLPIHLPLALAATLVAACFAPLLEPAAGRIGLWSLTHPQLSSFWNQLDQLPLVPWIGLHNSVTHGSMLIGMALAIPTFLLAWALLGLMRSASASPESKQNREENRTSDPDHQHEPIPHVSQFISSKADDNVKEEGLAETVEVKTGLNESAGIPDAGESSVVVQLESLLASCASEDAHDVGGEEVVARASRMAQLVDEMVAALDSDISDSNLQASEISTGDPFWVDGPNLDEASEVGWRVDATLAADDGLAAHLPAVWPETTSENVDKPEATETAADSEQENRVRSQSPFLGSTESSTTEPRLSQAASDEDLSSDSDEESWVVETRIEIVRLVSPETGLPVASPAASAVGSATDVVWEKAMKNTDRAKQVADGPETKQLQEKLVQEKPAGQSGGSHDLVKVHISHTATREGTEPGGPSLTMNVRSESARHEEALRYLLHHLKEIQDKV